jgi:selenocysteine lyase/cysteine desulfurase
VNLRAHFHRFLSADPDRVHFAAHSHHLWPDVSFDAHMQAWLDAARLADRKWDHVFGEIVPRVQGHIARRLGLRDGSSVVFAPNTHELVLRILSCLPADGSARPIRVLTTDSEFHSFTRQSARLEEEGLLVITRVPTQPFATFVERFDGAARAASFDLVFLSHVFFNSGWAIPDLSRALEAAIGSSAYVVVDGYHAFAALPIDLTPLRDRIFYLAGGYKYAMSGEGCCFCHVPPGYAERPRNTGWYASFGTLEKKQSGVPYATGGARMFGATFDPTALYRFDAAMSLLDRLSIDAAKIHAHAHAMQARFMTELAQAPELPLRAEMLVVPMDEASRGHFLTFETPRAAEIQERLQRANVITDVRGDRVRFGFGLYHDEDEIARGVRRMREVFTS